MNTKITFTYKDVPYVLEYTRDIIRRMEASGFSIEEFTKKPMLNIDIAFKGLFIKNHKRTNEKVIEEIFEKFSNKEALITKMTEMLTEAYSSLVDDENDDAEGNIVWDTVESK